MKTPGIKLPARRVLAIAIGALFIGGGAYTLLGHDGNAATKATAPTPSITVSVLEPASAGFDHVITASGTVGARDELLVGSDASGVRLTEVFVDVGSVVKKGQLLARADDRELQAQLAQQEALIKQAEVEFTQARANLERADALKNSGVYSVEAMQTRRTSAAAAAAKVEMAIAQKRELEVKFGHTRIVAPSAGVVSRRTATVGAVIQPGTELFRVIRDGELEWRAELPGHSLVRVTPGAKARIALDDGRTLDAKVRMVAPTIDAATRNGLLYVSLPPGAALRAGGHARGEILVDSATALSLPESSVISRDGYAFVYLIGKDDIARLTRVETGSRQRGLVEIIGGLPADARVVGTGAGFVKDGDLVRIATGQTLAQAGAQ